MLLPKALKTLESLQLSPVQLQKLYQVCSSSLRSSNSNSIGVGNHFFKRTHSEKFTTATHGNHHHHHHHYRCFGTHSSSTQQNQLATWNRLDLQLKSGESKTINTLPQIQSMAKTSLFSQKHSSFSTLHNNKTHFMTSNPSNKQQKNDNDTSSNNNENESENESHSSNAANVGVSHIIREKRAQIVKERRNKRFAFFAVGGLLIGGGVFFMMNAFQDSFMYYMTPTDLLEKIGTLDEKKHIRLGGLVLDGSLKKPTGSATEYEFVVTDLSTDIFVRYDGLLPDLFKEGKSVVIEGYFKKSTGVFVASIVLAKHDENYMPTEVAEALAKNREKKDILEKVQAKLEAEKKNHTA